MMTAAAVVPIIKAHGIRNDTDGGTTIRNSVVADGGTFGQVVGGRISFHYDEWKEKKGQCRALLDDDPWQWYCWSWIVKRCVLHFIIMFISTITIGISVDPRLSTAVEHEDSRTTTLCFDNDFWLLPRWKKERKNEQNRFSWRNVLKAAVHAPGKTSFCSSSSLLLPITKAIAWWGTCHLACFHIVTRPSLSIGYP